MIPRSKYLRGSISMGSGLQPVHEHYKLDVRRYLTRSTIENHLCFTRLDATACLKRESPSSSGKTGRRKLLPNTIDRVV